MEERLDILLVEDDELDILNVERALRHAAVHVSLRVARDGFEALQLLDLDGPPTVVLLDLGMPGMDGLELLRRIRARADLRALPVVVLTGSPDEDDRGEAMRFGVAGYLQKPLSMARFEECLDGFHP